jgi:hypothetical protein
MSSQTDDLGPVEAWLEEIAKAAGQELDVVKAVLAEHGVRPQTALPRPHSLRVTEVEFEGVRPAPAGANDGNASEEGDPFHFQWKPGPGVWCLASSGKSEAGKSSVLEIALWCLRGRSGLQRGVQGWLRRVRTEFVLDDETLVVDMTVSNSKPTGTHFRRDNQSGRPRQRCGTEIGVFRQLFEEVVDARLVARVEFSWEEISRALGITKQSAHERLRRLDPQT